MNSTIEKRSYITPHIMAIELDREISLQLESPPIGPDEPGYIGSLAPEYFKSNPFNTNC